MRRPLRVRFAPSPTGYLHVGGLRTALLNQLCARRNGGQWILRIEDTDQTRVVDGAVAALQESLRWAGLEYDEGPDVGGPYGPYVQSQRLDKYTAYANKLLQSGHAYRDFRPPTQREENARASALLREAYLPPSEAEAQENARVARKAEAQAREAEQTMRRFIGDASHELRTPLTSVSGYAELYRTGQTDDLNLVLDSISAEAERMSVLVQDLLDLARMDNSRPLEHKSVDILSVAISVIQNMKVNYPDRDISMTNNCVELPIVTGDSARLHQVLTNLMTNALKHAGPEAAVRIALDDSTLGTSPKKKAVRIRVIDNGVGIPPEDSEHIFERFYRADSSRSRHQGGGSGLGLSIVQGLVEQHGGKVTADSVVDEGTTFTVLLPHE